MMSDKEFFELQLRVQICPAQCEWPKPDVTFSIMGDKPTAKVMQNDVAEHGDETAFELAAIRAPLAHLRSFPSIQKREQVSLLSLHGLHFVIGSGKLIELDVTGSRFVKLADA